MFRDEDGNLRTPSFVVDLSGMPLPTKSLFVAIVFTTTTIHNTLTAFVGFVLGAKVARRD